MTTITICSIRSMIKCIPYHIKYCKSNQEIRSLVTISRSTNNNVIYGTTISRINGITVRFIHKIGDKIPINYVKGIKRFNCLK